MSNRHALVPSFPRVPKTRRAKTWTFEAFGGSFKSGRADPQEAWCHPSRLLTRFEPSTRPLLVPLAA